jgi:hypothetical protein
MVRGNRIFELFKSQAFNFTESKSERRIGLCILFIQFIFFLTVEMIYVIMDLIFKKTFDIISHLFFFSLMVNISSNIALISYQSRIISLQIDEFFANFSLNKLPEIYRFMCKVNNFVKKFDSLISSSSFMLITNSCVICISHLCLLMIKSEEKFSFFAHIMSFLENILLLFTLCFSCNIIPKRFGILCDKIEESMSEYVTNYSSLYDLNNHLILFKMNSIKQEIGFTAMGLFKINSNTILSVFGLIISYSVVLIQTSQQS